MTKLALKWLVIAILATMLRSTMVSGTGGDANFIRGDFNGDGALNIADGIGVLSYLFQMAPTDCLSAGDGNDDGNVDIGDAIFVLNYLFAGGPAPQPPFPGCGADPTPDALRCGTGGGSIGVCGGDLPPDLIASFVPDDLEENPGVCLVHNPTVITPSNFNSNKILMRKVTLSAGGTLTSGFIRLQLISGTLQLFTSSGVPIVLPFDYAVPSLPQDFYVHSPVLGTATIKATHWTTSFPPAPPVLADLVNFSIKKKSKDVGSDLPGYPGFSGKSAFNPSDDVETGLDPNQLLDRVGQSYRVYVVDHRPPSVWALDNVLIDVTGGFETAAVTAGGFANNIVSAWSAPLDAGPDFAKGYDVVLDFGLDGTLDPGDLITGFSEVEAGFYVLRDLTASGLHGVTTVDFGIGPGQLARCYYPSGIAALGALPLIAFGPTASQAHTAYDDLCAHLASFGYVVVSLENGASLGIEAAALASLAGIAFFVDNLALIGSGELAGHVDVSRMAWIGHGQGSEAMVRAYALFATGVWSHPALLPGSVRLVGGIAPTLQLGAALSNPFDVNCFVLVGAADGIVSGDPACDECQSLRLAEAATGRVAVTYVHGAGHNDFACCGPPDAVGPDLIGATGAQAVARAYVLAAVKWFVDEHPAAREVLSNHFSSFHPVGLPPTVVIAQQYRPLASESAIVEDFQSNSADTLSSSGGAVAVVVNNYVEGLLNDADGSLDWLAPADAMNGMTLAADLFDLAAGAVFDWNPGELRSCEWSVVPTLSDFTSYEFLSLRACQGTRHPLTDALADELTFTITLRDTIGTSSSISIAVFGSIPRPYQRASSGAGVGWINEFARVRLRLADFLSGGTGLNLGAIEAIRIDCGGPYGSAQGRLGIDDLMVTRE
ncbi:MAG: hypothetical protein ACKVX7_03980 [Planctomycetota bacterium]